MDPKQQHQLGEDISFGMQQTLACWATDFIDPYVGKWFQDQFKSEVHNGTLAHTWGGEIIGDSAAFFMFLGVRRFFPQPVEWLKYAAESLGRPVYDRLGKKHLSVWAYQKHIAPDSTEYQQKLAEWREFQADNFAKSSVITVSSIAANVATQKAMGNTHHPGVIVASKLIGAAITMGAMLGARFVVPDTLRELDSELDEHYFTPLIRKTQKLLGAEPGHVEKLAEKQSAMWKIDHGIIS